MTTELVFCDWHVEFLLAVPKLMYGFGDDKHVAHDSVAVMEEILIEYIVDVVSLLFVPARPALTLHPVSNSSLFYEEEQTAD